MPKKRFPISTCLGFRLACSVFSGMLPLLVWIYYAGCVTFASPNHVSLVAAVGIALIISYALISFLVLRKTDRLIQLVDQIANGNVNVRYGPSYQKGLFDYIGIHFDEILERLQRQNSMMEQKDKLLTIITRFLREATLIKSEIELARSCLLTVAELTKSNVGWIGMLNDTNKFEIIALEKLNKNLSQASCQSHLAPRFMAFTDLWNEIRKTGRPCSINEPIKISDISGTWESDCCLFPYVGIPLKQGRHVIGMIGLANKEKSYENSDMDAVEAVTTAITEALMCRKVVEIANNNQKIFETISQNNLAEISIISNDYKIIWTNLTVQHSFGTCVGKFCHKIFQQNDVPCQECQLPEVLANGTTAASFDVATTGNLDNKKYCKVVLIPILNKNGKSSQVLSVRFPIADVKNSQEALSIKIKELARSNADLEQFAYVASHDLQEPLRMVASFTQLLGQRYKGKLDADADEFIAYAVDGASRMQRMIEDLLTYSRVSTRGKPLERTDCEAILKTALANLNGAIAESNVCITHDPLPIIKADASQITQLFQNLLSNAIKFRNGESPNIHISVQNNTVEWLFSFKDNGIGIDQSYKEKIFVIFQRLHNRADYPGTGIGLSLCKKIVERHGGHIWVDSQVGKGSTFHFTLPMDA